MKIEDLVEVQMKVNAEVVYEDDQITYNQPEYWEIAQQVGDCEDYALRKLRELLARGWPIEKLRLAFCWVGTVGSNNGHGVLIAEFENDLYVLDNRYEGVYAVPDIDEYVWHSCQEIGGSRRWVPCRQVFEKFYP